MPIYEYRCKKCGEFEQMQKITDKPLQRCPKCRCKVSKLISSSAFHLKGSGWYVTDYARKGSSDGGESRSSDTTSASESKSTTKTESKSTSKSEKKTSGSSKASAAA